VIPAGLDFRLDDLPEQGVLFLRNLTDVHANLRNGSVLDLGSTRYHRLFEEAPEITSVAQIHRVAQGLDLADAVRDPAFHLVSETFHIIRAAQGIRDFAAVGLKPDDLLGPECEQMGLPAGRPIRLVECRDFHRLYPGECERHGLPYAQ
jgi:hypothetical protein